jgi:hypothetical protein
MGFTNLYSLLLFASLYHYGVKTYKLCVNPVFKKEGSRIILTQNKYPISKKYYFDYLKRMKEDNETSFNLKHFTTSNYVRKYDINEDAVLKSKSAIKIGRSRLYFLLPGNSN